MAVDELSEPMVTFQRWVVSIACFFQLLSHILDLDARQHVFSSAEAPIKAKGTLEHPR
jgi:hypothetical protein